MMRALALLIVLFASRSHARAPFDPVYLAQPVPGADRATSPDGWRLGKLCNVTSAPYNAVGDGKANDTAAIQSAIDDCGGLAEGGTVLLPSGGTFKTGSLWLRSNLTFRVEDGATLLGSDDHDDYPIVYTRRGSVMMWAHAGFLNGARCTRLKDPLVGWDDCAEWDTLANVAIEGAGTLDANGEKWAEKGGDDRSMMIDLLYVDGLTLRGLRIRRPAFWTVHPCFCNNVRVTGLDVETSGHNTDGIDPDSSWNMYIANNTFSTGDDCIAIKAGKDWSGRLVNISTENILAERNVYKEGHGVSIGSETSGWVRNVVIRDSTCDGTNVGVRLKSMRGRGGGIENVLYQNMSGSVEQAVSISLNYHTADPTNASATPIFRNITIADVQFKAGSDGFLDCEGLDDSEVTQVQMRNVKVTGSDKQKCSYCKGDSKDTSPKPCFDSAL